MTTGVHIIEALKAQTGTMELTFLQSCFRELEAELRRKSTLTRAGVYLCVVLVLFYLWRVPNKKGHWVPIPSEVDSQLIICIMIRVQCLCQNIFAVI